MLIGGRSVIAKAFLDGEMVERCVAASVPGGWVESHRLRDGRPYVENDEVATERRHGNVRIVVDDVGMQLKAEFEAAPAGSRDVEDSVRRPGVAG